MQASTSLKRGLQPARATETTVPTSAAITGPAYATPGAPAPAPVPTAATPAPAGATPAPTTLGSDLCAVVAYLHKNCNSEVLEAFGALELTLTQIKLLHYLEQARSAVTLKRAAELVHVSFPAASRAVEDLVRRGYVERSEDHDDRRYKRVAPTEAGLAVTRRLAAARLHGLEQFTQTLTDHERRTLGPALSLLLQRPDVAACRPEGSTS